VASARGWRWEEEQRAAPGGGAGAEGVERGRENVGEREGGAVAAGGDATVAERWQWQPESERREETCGAHYYTSAMCSETTLKTSQGRNLPGFIT